MVMKIYLRISNGWSQPVLNRSRETCDLDGAKLWIGPGDKIYCDQTHDIATVTKLQKIAEEKTAI
jgi:hypothetical protein